ncbi:MAG: DUF3892 domain-containing protein [Planctomycetota bacterium]|nr:DUF3892 domain-containing protein [Planctomycetota bacterium]MDA1213668.1 DUF3892 domain-containing protein [Planctomycetota bacterium]
MARRQVVSVRRSTHTNLIAGLANPGEPWSPRASEKVIADIESNEHSYFVMVSEGNAQFIQVGNGDNGKYLYIKGEKTGRNYLLDLPNY